VKTILTSLVVVLATSSIFSSPKKQEAQRHSGWSVNVLSQIGHEPMASVELLLSEPSRLSANASPNCGIYVAQMTDRWSDPGIPPRSNKGELVSGFRFNGWMEDGKAKVTVWALLNAKGAIQPSLEDKDLTGQLVDTFVIEPGESKVINELGNFGVKPVELSITRIK